VDITYIRKIVEYKDKLEYIKSAAYNADTPKHMTSDHTNIAACFGL